MSWKPAPVIGGAYSDDAKAWTCQDTVNWIPVAAERPGGRSPTMLRGVPGMRTFCITGSGKPIRGARNVEGLLLVVTGTTLYKVSTKGAATAIGTIPGVGRVSMSHNQIAGGNEVAIANGQSGYVYNTVTGTLAQITDEGFPGAISFDFIDGYITGIEPARRFAFHSNLAAATDYNTLDRYEAEGSPDKLVGQMVDHREWWLFSERTIEPFVNTGAATNTFQRASNTMIEVGCASGASIAQMDSSVFWCGNDGIIYRANGYTPQRISTSALEQALARCHLAQCFAFTFEDRGHKIYYLTCPDGQTWGYDAATGEWHRRQSEGLSRWRINTLTKWNGVWIAGDYTNGKLYELNWDVQDEDHAVLERRRITGVLSDNQNRVTVDGVALVFDTGTTTEPKLLLPPISLAGDVPDGPIGEVVGYQYTVSGGVLPRSVSIASGALPAGLSMSASGLVTGTRTAVGDFAWTVRATDANGASVEIADTSRTRDVFIYVSHSTQNKVYALRRSTGALSATIPVGVHPSGVAINPDGTRVYVANASSNTVSVIDTGTNVVIATITVGTNPVDICVSKDGTRAYTANQSSSTVSVLDLTTNALISTVAKGSSPFACNTNPVNGDIYVVSGGNSTVYLLNSDGSTKASVAATSPSGVNASPDGLCFYVAGYDGLTAFDATTHANLGNINLRGGFGPQDVEITPDGKTAYVADYNYTDLKVVDVTNKAAMTLITSIASVGKSTRIAMDSIGSKAYVTTAAGTVVIDVATNAIETTYPYGDFGVAVGVAP